MYDRQEFDIGLHAAMVTIKSYGKRLWLKLWRSFSLLGPGQGFPMQQKINQSSLSDTKIKNKKQKTKTKTKQFY